MFRNIGKIIKVMAEVLWWIGTVTIVGIILIWPYAFILYGFGELITQTTDIAKSCKRMQMLYIGNKTGENAGIEDETIKQIHDEIIEEYEEEKNQYVDEDEIINTPQKNECPCCFNPISPEDKECSYCGYKLK